MDSIKEAVGTILHELSRAVEDKILWTPFIHRVSRTQSHVTHTIHIIKSLKFV